MIWPLLVLLTLPAQGAVDQTSTLIDERVVVIDATPARGRLIEVALRARGLRLLDDAERPGLDGHDARPAVGDREVVRSRLLAARAALRQLDQDAATAAADEAAAEMLRLDRPEDHNELLVDTLLLRAGLQLGRADVDNARRTVLLATRLEPGRAALDAALHAPSLVEAWAAARVDDATAPRAVIVVRPRVLGGVATTGRTSDQSAEVVVDGRPAVVRAGLLELTRGPHLITIRASGCRGLSRIVDVADGADVAIEDVLLPDDVIAARQALVATVLGGDPTVLKTLRERADADVIVAHIVDDAGADTLWAQRGEAPALRVDVAVDAPADVAADGIMRALAPAPVPLPVVPGAVDPDDDGPLWWLVGGGVGAVLLGGAAVVTWVLWPGEAPPPPARPVTLTAPVI